MLTEDPDPAWLKLPSMLYVSSDVMKSYDRKMFPSITPYRKFIDDDNEISLLDAKYMNVDSLNRKAKRYDIHVDKSDTPIERLVKYSVYLARKKDKTSHIPGNSETNTLLFDVATAKVKGDKSLADFFEKFPNVYSFVTREILEFRGKRKGGEYSANRYIFNENDGVLEKKDTIIVPGQGYMRAIDPDNGYPIETSEERGPIENLKDMGLECGDLRGYWFIGLPPKKHESRLVTRHLHQSGSCLVNINVDDNIFHADNQHYALLLRDNYPMWQRLRDNVKRLFL